jgi:plastin-3
MSEDGVRGASVILTQDQLEELTNVFKSIDVDGTGTISISELGDALAIVGLRLPAYKVRDLIRQYDTRIRDDALDFEEFKMLYAVLREAHDFGSQFKKVVTTKSGLDNYAGMSALSAEGTTHTVRKEEQIAFSNWINKNMAADEDCQKYLPLDPETRDLYIRCNDGVIFCKLVNLSQPGTIDERTINKGKLSIYHMIENLTLALTSSQSIGCNIVNIGAEDLHAGKPHLVLGLLWQIIRIGLLSDINLHEHPNLAILLDDSESIEELMKLSPEQILIRWVNYHLSRSPCQRRIANFTTDIQDSVAYVYLLNQIAPKEAGVTTEAESASNLHDRAERMLQEADKIGCRSFVEPSDVVSGNYKLNLAFVANLFNMYPGLDQSDALNDIDMSSISEETREERMYRNWMNSMGVSPFVHHLYSDLTSGLIIFQLYDIIRPGIVDWSRVKKTFHHMRVMMEKIENCNYVVELGKQSRFSLVGIDGKDLYDGNQTLTLAVVWQLMKAYTLSVLTKLAGQDAGHPIVEREIVEWANQKLQHGGKKSHITGFNDPTIADSRAVLDLIDTIKKGSVNYDNIKSSHTHAERLDNAKFAISMARKIGAPVYALPEDIVEVKAKMVMTIFACLMIKDFQPPQQKRIV